LRTRCPFLKSTVFCDRFLSDGETKNQYDRTEITIIPSFQLQCTLIKLCENQKNTRCLFLPIFIRIGQKIWIFYYWPIFQGVSFFWLRFQMAVIPKLVQVSYIMLKCFEISLISEPLLNLLLDFIAWLSISKTRNEPSCNCPEYTLWKLHITQPINAR